MAQPKYSLLNITGCRFGRLVAIEMCYLEGKGHIKYWKCQCDCGNTGYWRPNVLVSGMTKSCGCYSHDALVKRNTKHGLAIRDRRHPEYRVWSSMRNRCSNSNHQQWFDYGGRGIKVCDRWQNFKNFIADMGPRPTPQHTIERIDNDGNYCPENCKWATRAEQNLNYSRNHYVEFRGETLTISQWAKRLGMKQHTLIQRFEHGWTEEMALTTSVRPRHHYITHNGKTMCRREWAKELGISEMTLKKRRQLGWSEKEMLETPVTNYDLTYNGRSQSTAQWAEDTGIPQKTIQYRLAHGWSIEKTLTTPKAPRSSACGPLTYNGETLSQAEWSRRLNVRPGLIEKRLRLGWSIEETLTTPVLTKYQNKKEKD